jgi:membrane carboxypeptidase/penicillin-binding protein
VARNILLDAEERTQQTASRKIKEIVLAQELTRQYTKK